MRLLKWNSDRELRMSPICAPEWTIPTGSLKGNWRRQSLVSQGCKRTWRFTPVKEMNNESHFIANPRLTLEEKNCNIYLLFIAFLLYLWRWTFWGQETNILTTEKAKYWHYTNKCVFINLQHFCCYWGVIRIRLGTGLVKAGVTRLGL